MNAPLSYGQQRLWFLDQLNPGNPAYNVAAAFRLRGDLDVAALELSLNEIIRRHEILRTHFVAIEEQPRQVISTTGDITLPLIAVVGSSDQEHEDAAQELVDLEVRRSFDLATGPLLRPMLLRLGQEDHVLLITMHHIVSDAWSMRILFRELDTLYNAFHENVSSPLEMLPTQYAGYSEWQREWMSGDRLAEQLTYWKEQLADAASVLELPGDRPRPATQSHQGRRAQFVFSAVLTKRLKELSRSERATLFMTLLTAFQILLYRYSGQTDILVGTPTANRNRIELEGLIGFFVNTLVMRAQFQPRKSFRETLRSTRQVCVGAYAHHDIPVELLLEHLQTERHLAHNPLFQVMFQVQNVPVEAPKLIGLQVSRFNIKTETAKFDLMMSITESQQALTGWLEYNTDLFDETTITRMLGHFKRLLESIVSNPEQSVSELAFLSREERVQLLVDWNDTAAAYPSHCIHELIETQAARTPDAPAVSFEELTITYRELNERANQLAHYLRTRGVAAEEPVGICVERSIEMVVGLLGILKAGGAYVPLDASYPPERLRYMLADAKLKVLLTQEHLAGHFSEDPVEVLCFDQIAPELDHQSRVNPKPQTMAANLAYVIYTSGSTGRPKGVMITHQSVVNFLTSMNRSPGLGPMDTLLAVTTLSFDIAGLEIYLPLSVGACLRLVPREVALDGAALTSELERNQITAMQATPATWRLLLEAGWRGTKEFKVLCGGEAMSAELANDLVERCDELWNLFGPTETTIWSTAYRIADRVRIVSIGRPIANTELYILDDNLQPVPIGVAGELYIGGHGLARGYWGRSDLTAERFVPSPFAREAGSLLYRTGDLARYFADGNVEFLGRIDHQVKVRGFRIELAEIENALNQHELVRQSVVVVREDTPGEKCLVAYIVPDETNAPTVTELRDFLRTRLPDYMVPLLFVVLDALPLTPNRKVDRKALPPPTQTRPELTRAYIAPRTPAETVLEGIWTQLLPVKRIGIQDNFFDVGGHSLLAIQVISRIRETFKVEIPLSYMFGSPTIAGIAEKIEEARLSGQGVESRPLVRAARDRALKLSFPQLRMWFLNELDRGSPAYNIRMAVRLKGPLNVPALESSLSEIVRRHEVLRTAFRLVDAEPVQETLDGRDFRVTFADLSQLPEAEWEPELHRLMNREAHLSFDLSRGPFLRASVMRLGPEYHGFILVMHHIASDGWSMGILFRELSALYRAYCDGSSVSLGELPIQYADYAQWQRENISGDVLEKQLGYWKEQLVHLPTRIELATDRLRSETAESQWGMPYYQQISFDLTTALRELSRREGATLFMTLLAAFQVLIFRHTGQDDIVVGTPVANRTHLQVEGLIGFFVNTLVMRNKLNAKASFRETLSQVREMCLKAYENQDLPFEKLVEELRPERKLSHNAIFQILFQLQNAPMEDLKLADLRIDTMKIEGGMAKLDLAVNVKETGEGLLVNFRYNTDLFDRTTIARLAEHYVNLLERVVENADDRVSEVELLSKAERAQLLHEWNDTAVVVSDQCIHELIAAQAARTPEALAVSHAGKTLSYRELNERANQLAHYLRRKGVGREELVGICMERSLEMVVGLLGILKAGAAYVPLDASYPRERLRYMMADAGVRLLLSEERLAGDFADVEVLCVEQAAAELSEQSGENPVAPVSGGNLAYVIYTSGSTGAPKGVMIQHSSLTNFANAMAQMYEISRDDRVLQFASMSFDTSAEEIYPSLLRGACLVLRSEEMLSTPEGFLRQCTEQGITVLDLPTAYWHEMVASGAAKEFGENIRLVIIGGEKAQRERVRQWQDEVRREVRLVNTYGPTEATVVATASELGEWDGIGREVGIGRPLSNVQVYVLDECLEPVGVGIAGELYIGGAGVARGYLRRAEQTAERFVPHPHSECGGERLYRTGDLVRYRQSGELEYVGRQDEQVKVRGYRIELGEIEAVLNAHECVRESVVVLRESKKGAAQLVGYVVSEAELSVSELRRYVKERLPDYMVPGAFVKLPALPLTANGKVDRKMLPAVDAERPVLDAEFVPPRNFIEEQLAAAWSKLLPVEQIGIHDNFFELGGHSILLTQLASRIRQDFQIELSLRSLFTTPTIAELSQLIVARQFEQEDAVELARLLTEVQQLSPAEVNAQLESETFLTPRRSAAK